MKRLSLTVFMVIMLLTTLSVFADNSQVATISAMKGTISVMHQTSKTWDKGYEKMPLYVNDVLKTDKGSYADVKFAIGGQVGVNENTTIQITGSRQVSSSGKESFIQKIVITAGEIWAKITKQQEEMQFETKGGVIAIKGTEFVVEVNPDTDETIISLIEGKISFYDLKNIETIFKPGDKGTILGGILQIEKFLPQDLKKNLESKFKNLKNILNLINMDPNTIPDPNSILNSLPSDPNHTNFAPQTDPTPNPDVINSLPADPNHINFGP